MASVNTAADGKGFRAWINKRLPVDEFIESQLHGYYAPKNFNIWYFFGSLALLVFVLQIVTGIFLTMHYKVGETTAFDSVEYIMREVPNGWLLRYLHSTGASFFFIVVYLHMFRALMYGSYRAPRELLWLLGMFVYLALMAEAFFGYVLPWGNMSFWGAQVIVNLFGTIPVIGPGLVEWIRGDYGIADSTLNRFFSLHVVAVPFALALLILLHLVALRQVGSNNPDGVEIKENLGKDGKPVDGIPFHPYYTIKDIVGVGVFLALFAVVVFFVPTFGGYFLEGPNFEPANPLSTPLHIAPVWYFTPYYAILRAVPSQGWGALLMGLSVAIWLFVPWLDKSPVKSIRYKGWLSKLWLGIFAVSFLALMVLGLLPAEGTYVILARIFTVLYFAFFVLMPIYTRMESVKAPPKRLSAAHGVVLALLGVGLMAGSGRVEAAEGAATTDACAANYQPEWKHWAADSDTNSLPSLQRGAKDFMGYCAGCHSLKFMRYSRLGQDLKIPENLLETSLMPPGANKNDYIVPALAAADGETWFGKPPPDLSLIVRAKGANHVYRFMKTFYVDGKSMTTGVNNLALPGTAMPHVLSDLQGLQTAVFRNCEQKSAGGTSVVQVFEKFDSGSAGKLSSADYDRTVRDIVNFLDYVGDPSQNERRSLGIWVVLFLLAFSGIAYMLKQEYWKDVH